MLFARTMLKRMQLCALVKLVTQTQVLHHHMLAQVMLRGIGCFTIRNPAFLSYSPILDSCLVKNGGCDPNAACSHDSKTNAVVCRCKPGFTNTGSGSTVVCKGNSFFYLTLAYTSFL